MTGRLELGVPSVLTEVEASVLHETKEWVAASGWMDLCQIDIKRVNCVCHADLETREWVLTKTRKNSAPTGPMEEGDATHASPRPLCDISICLASRCFELDLTQLLPLEVGLCARSSMRWPSMLGGGGTFKSWSLGLGI